MAKKLVKIGGKLLVTNKLTGIEPKPKPLILKMDTTKQDSGDDDPNDDEVTLHLNSDLNYDFTVDWGDGTTQDIDNDDVANLPDGGWGVRLLNHKYETPGAYDVEIKGVFGGLYGWSDGKSKYMEVTQWGDPYWESLNNAFRNCENLKITATDLPNWENVTDALNCFNYCTSLETIPTGLFDICTEVTSFRNCFNSCSSLTEIPTGLFDNCTEVTTFGWCFEGCTSLTSIPSGLFDNCTKVTTFTECFRNCTSLTSLPTGLFDNNIEATRFGGCFWDCTSLETIPDGLFDNCTEVTHFSNCFNNCTSLDLSGITVDTWNVGNVIYMRSMFQNCTNITDIPGIEQWEPFKIGGSSWQGMRDMLLDTTLPTTRYSDMLINFADKADQFENTGITFGGGNSKYNTDGETARNTLINDYFWDITDGGPE